MQIYPLHRRQFELLVSATVSQNLLFTQNELRRLLNGPQYVIGNFGACGTTVSLDSELPYIRTSAFQDALEFKPNIVIIMLGTNDSQSNLELYNSSFVNDYKKIIEAFQALPSRAENLDCTAAADF